MGAEAALPTVRISCVVVPGGPGTMTRGRRRCEVEGAASCLLWKGSGKAGMG